MPNRLAELHTISTNNFDVWNWNPGFAVRRMAISASLDSKLRAVSDTLFDDSLTQQGDDDLKSDAFWSRYAHLARRLVFVVVAVLLVDAFRRESSPPKLLNGNSS